MFWLIRVFFKALLLFFSALFSLPRLWRSTPHSSWRTLWRCTWTMPPGLLMSWGSFRRTCARMAGILLTLSTSSSGKWLFLCLKKKRKKNPKLKWSSCCFLFWGRGEVEAQWVMRRDCSLLLCSKPRKWCWMEKADFSSVSPSTQCSGCQEVSSPLWAAGHPVNSRILAEGKGKGSNIDPDEQSPSSSPAEKHHLYPLPGVVIAACLC